MSDGRISQGDIVAASAYQEVQDLNARVQELVATFRELKSTASSFEIKIDGGGGIKELVGILKEMSTAGKGIADLKKNLAGLTADIAKLAKAQADGAAASDKAALAAERLATQQEKTRAASAAANEVERKAAEAKEKSARATEALIAAEERRNQERNEAAARDAANVANFQNEVNALYASVTGHQACSVAIRQEAAEKAALAAATTDVAARAALENEVLALNTAAAKSDALAKNALKEANRNVAAEVAKTLSIEAQAEAQTRKNISAAEAQLLQDQKLEANLEKLNGAYYQLQAAYSAAAAKAKNLGAASLLDPSVTAEYNAAAKAAKDLQNQLLAIDANVGQHTRNVGNYKSAYNGLSASVNQLTRELPALAISPNTFFLAISNNIPIFVDEVNKIRNASKLAREESEKLSRAAAIHAEQAAIDKGATEAQAKAAGKLAAAQAIATPEQLAGAAAARLNAESAAVNAGMTELEAKAAGDAAAAQFLLNQQQKASPGLLAKLGSALLSWQTLISVGVALLTLYGGKLLDLVRGVGAAEKAQKDYQKAVEEGNKTAGAEIGKLLELKDKLQSNTLSRGQISDAIDKAKKAYPEYLALLTEENRSTALVNDAIEKQIELIRIRAAGNAATKALGDAETAYLDAIEKRSKALQGQYGVWDRTTAFVRGLSPEYAALRSAEKDVSETEDLLTKARLRAQDPELYTINLLKENVATIKQKIKLDEQEIEGKSKSGLLSRVLVSSMEAENTRRTLNILSIEDEIEKLEELRKAKLHLSSVPVPNNIFDNVSKQAEIDALNAEKGSAAERSALGVKINADAFKSIQTLIKTYNEKYNLWGEDLDKNKQYLKDVELIQAKAKRAVEDLAPKAPKTRKPRMYDPTNAEIKGLEDLNAATNEFAKQRVETEMAASKAIFDDETIALQQRLDAYNEYVKGQQQLNVIAENAELNAVQIKLDKIKEIEGIDASKRTSAQKGLLLDKAALLLQEQTMLEKYRLKEQEINSDAQKKEQDIFQSSTKYQINLLNSKFSAFRDQASQETAMRLSNLNKQREAGEITEKEFWSARQRIAAGESRLLFDKQLEFLQAEYSRIIDDPTIPNEVKSALQKLKGDLEKVRPEPRKTESRSLLEYLGINSRADIEAKEAAQQLNRARADLDGAIEEYGNRQQYWADELYRIRKEAAAKFGEGSDDYNKAIGDATAKQGEGLANAEENINRFAKAFEIASDSVKDSIAKSAEGLKQSIASSLKGLYETLFKAVDQARENYYTERFNQLDTEKKKIEENADAERAAIESSLLSADEKQKQLQAIDARKAAADKAADVKERALKRQQAEAARKDAVFKIKMEGGIAAAKALSGAAENPLLAIAAAALIAAQTVASVMLINSEPLPEYWKGTPRQGHPFDGPARVGERGTELGILPSGKMFLTPDNATEMFLPKGTHIIPADKLAASAHQSSMLDMTAAHGGSTAEGWAAAFAHNNDRSLKEMTNAIRDTIKEIPVTQLYWDDGELKKSNKKAYSSVKFYNRLKGWV